MRIITTIFAATTLFLVSCNNYQKTKSGMSYKITSAGSKDKIKQGNVIKFNLELKLTGKDTVLVNTKETMPGYMPVDTARMPKHYFTEIVTLLGKGDKVDFVLSVDSLVNLKMIPEYDKLFKKGGTIKGKLEIVKIYASDKEAEGDYQKDMEAAQVKQKAKIEKESTAATAKEIKVIDKYVADNKLKPVKTANGVLVVIEKEGTGPKADSSKQVFVMYKGYTLDGKVFDKNMEADAMHKDPYPVVIGQHGVIPGWEDGLQYFSKGTKGKLIIPFAMGYGAQGNQGIAPFATLVFDMEVVDMKDAPPAQQQRQMPMKQDAHSAEHK